MPNIIPNSTLTKVDAIGKVPYDLETGHEKAADTKQKVKTVPPKCPNTWQPWCGRDVEATF